MNNSLLITTLTYETYLGFVERRRYRDKVVSIKKDSTLCCQRP